MSFIKNKVFVLFVIVQFDKEQDSLCCPKHRYYFGTHIKARPNFLLIL